MSITVTDPTALGFAPDRLDRIAPFLKDRYLDPGRLPHAALLVSRAGEPAFLSVQGDAREGQPLREDAIFRIASMTKPITSTVFMQLVEECKTSLDAPVTSVLPEWRDLGVFVTGGGQAPWRTRRPASPMRMVDLLRHTAGLTYSFQERTPVDAAYREAGFERFDGGDLEAFVAALATLPIEFNPGSAWTYSVATDVLGAIIQRIEGKPLDQVIAERVTGPLGMVDTGFQVPADKVDRVPDCYALTPGGETRLYDPGTDTAWGRPPKLLSGGGGMVSTLSDYHRFCRMLLDGGELDGARIVSRTTIDLMTANHLGEGRDLTRMSRGMFSEVDNAGVGFGLGFAVTIDPAATLLPGSAGEYRWGGMFSTAFTIDPTEELITVFMTQLMPSSAYPIRPQLKRLIYAALD